MKPTKEMLKEYAAIAKKSNRNMKDCIKAHLLDEDLAVDIEKMFRNP